MENESKAVDVDTDYAKMAEQTERYEDMAKVRRELTMPLVGW